MFCSDLYAVFCTFLFLIYNLPSFYFILLSLVYSILIYFVLFYSALFYYKLFYSMLFFSILFYSSHSVLLHCSPEITSIPPFIYHITLLIIFLHSFHTPCLYISFLNFLFFTSKYSLSIFSF
jgi:hypothetical protein